MGNDRSAEPLALTGLVGHDLVQVPLVGDALQHGSPEVRGTRARNRRRDP